MRVDPVKDIDDFIRLTADHRERWDLSSYQTMIDDLRNFLPDIKAKLIALREIKIIIEQSDEELRI